MHMFLVTTTLQPSLAASYELVRSLQVAAAHPVQEEIAVAEPHLRADCVLGLQV